MLGIPARLLASLLYAAGSYLLFPLPAADPDVTPLLFIVSFQSPRLFEVFAAMTVFAPFAVSFVLLSVAQSVVSVWLTSVKSARTRGRLPDWPLSPTDDEPSLVIGEIHHRTELREVSHPTWLQMPEKGLYTGLAIFGAIGTGKTTACMRPYCRQLLEWQHKDPEKRAAALVLEVKGDFCYDVQDMLAKYGRTDDYMELTLGDNGCMWNPLNAPWVDSYTLAYTLAGLINQLFGKGKEPFWQQAYTSTVRWILELYRSFPDPWFTFSDLYFTMVNKAALGELVDKNARKTYGKYRYVLRVDADVYEQHGDRISEITVTRDDVDAAAAQTAAGNKPKFPPPASALKGEQAEEIVKIDWLPFRDNYEANVGDIGYGAFGWEASKDPEILFAYVCTAQPSADELDLTAKIANWYKNEWLGLDDKLRSSIVIGMSVFLGIFITPDVARIFCPPRLSDLPEDQKHRMMPPLIDVIESGRVLALNMPAGANGALARAAGVMLKQAWLSTLLLRPAAMKKDKIAAAKEKRPEKYWRPAVFICDEYQAFVTCGEDDPSGDEKAFALTRQSRCIPIVATQSIVSLKAVLGEGEAWRALMQTLRSRIFMSLGDDFSAKTASELLGQVTRISRSFSLSENTGKASVSLLTGKVGGGSASAGISKSYAERREALFHPRDLTLLGTCQAIAQIFDGRVVRDATRVYLKPDYLARDLPYFRARDKGAL